MDWQYFLIGILSAADALIGGYVFFRNPSKPLNRAFFVFAFGMSVIGAGMILLFETHNIIFDRMVFAGGYAMVAGLVLLSMKFPTDEPLRPAAWLAFLPLIALAVMTPFGLLVKDVIFRADGLLQPVSGPAMPAFVVVIGAYALLSGWEFRRRYLRLSGIARLQMQYLALGAGAFSLAIFLCNVLLPALGNFELNMIGPMSSAVFLASIAYAMVRHNLLDIRLVIQRGAIYLALFSVVAAFYVALIFAINAWFLDILERRGAALLGAGLLTVCAGIFAVPLLEKAFRRWTDGIFFKDRYSYPEALQRLGAIFNRNVELARMIETASAGLKEILKASDAAIVLFRDTGLAPESEWRARVRAFTALQEGTAILGEKLSAAADPLAQALWKDYGIEVVAPIFLDRKPIGAIVLGSKRSGEPYLREDAQLLDTLACQAAVAIEKARLFEELRDYSSSLEDRVRLRTADLERMQNDQRQMIVDISHSLQTPLAAVKSELEFLKHQAGLPGHLKAFEHSIDSVSRFVYGLLSLARLEMDNGSSGAAAVDLSGLMLEMREYLEVIASEQGAAFVSEIAPDILVSGNKDQLEEAAMNILGNAFKYLDNTAEGRVRLSVQEERGCAILEVGDNGPGIPPEELDKIFERFYRGRSSADKEGTGLGLAISKKIAENHGGTISIESSLGQGTKVRVSLPLARR